jgi:hypothetical protein
MHHFRPHKVRNKINKRVAITLQEAHTQVCFCKMRITTDDKSVFFQERYRRICQQSKTHKKRLPGTAAAACTQAQRKEKEIATWSGFRRAFYHLPGRRRRRAQNILIRLSPEAKFLRSEKIDGVRTRARIFSSGEREFAVSALGVAVAATLSEASSHKI